MSRFDLFFILVDESNEVGNRKELICITMFSVDLYYYVLSTRHFVSQSNAFFSLNVQCAIVHYSRAYFNTFERSL